MRHCQTHGSLPHGNWWYYSPSESQTQVGRRDGGL
jgi:hypothetical protein